MIVSSHTTVFNAQCILLIRSYLEVIYRLVFIHIYQLMSLDHHHHRVVMSHLDTWSLGKVWISIDWFQHHPTVLSLSLSHFQCILFRIFVHIAFTSCAHCCFIFIPIQMNHCQLIGITVHVCASFRFGKMQCVVAQLHLITGDSLSNN